MLTIAIEVERLSYVGNQEKNVRSLVKSWDRVLKLAKWHH